jgi:YfiH family protein
MTLSVSLEFTTSTARWQWRTWQDRPYLTCDLLAPWQHGFFSRQFAPRTPEEIAPVFGDATSVHRVRQVHGKRVLSPSDCDRQADHSLPEADALITDSERQSIWVASADCTPLLIGDVRTGRVASIHAGWRGTARRIVPEAIACFLRAGSQLADLRVAMGPAIAGEVYQVAEEVALEVGKSCLDPASELSPREILASLMGLEEPTILADPEPGKVRIDVRRINALQLANLGIAAEQVAIAPHCTYQQPDFFFSYRRTREKSVQWSGIVSRG